MILITGAAGFIGFHTSLSLLKKGKKILGIDNLNDYYDVKLKNARLEILKSFPNFTFEKLDISEIEPLKKAFSGVTIVIHLAAQAGVRYSLENPNAYIKSNINGHLNILECCRNSNSIERLVYASSSSVYGGNTKIPFSESDTTDHPISLYAATKKSDELLSETYNHLFNIPMIGLRFFTVYGEYGRPDMAPFKFTDAILKGNPIDVYNNGDMKRDFTYVEDIVSGILSATEYNIGTAHKIYNLGNNNPEKLMDFIFLIEKLTSKKAIINFKPMQDGDVKETYADITKASKDLGYKPLTNLATGLEKVVNWHINYTK